MTIREMHITLDQLLNEIVSNVHGKILDEDKDNILNMHIRQFVRSRAYDPPADRRDDYDIERNIEGLQSLISTYEFSSPLVYPGDPNAKYVELGELVDTGQVAWFSKPDPTTPFTAGDKYLISHKYSGDDFTLYGATTEQNITGGSFIATMSTAIQPSGFPSSTVLVYGLNLYHLSTSGALSAGITYKVSQGTLTFTGTSVVAPGIRVYNNTYPGVDVIYGVNLAGNLVLSAGDRFRINGEMTAGGWANGSVLKRINAANEYFKYIKSKSKVLFDCGTGTEYDIKKNRLVKSRDSDTYNQHSYGSVLSAPICYVEGNKLVVIHTSGKPNIPIGRRFDIDTIYLTYYRKPAIVSLYANQDCDLDEIVHDEIVQDAAKTISTSIKNGTWQQIRANVVEDNMNPNGLKV